MSLASDGGFGPPPKSDPRERLSIALDALEAEARDMGRDFQAALAAERKATVERVRAIVALLRAEVLADTDSSRWRQGGFWVLDQLTGHLDAEAAR